MAESAESGPSQSSRIVVLAITAAVALAFGFQLARWTAAPAAQPSDSPAATAAGSGHTHPAHAGPAADVGGLSISAAGYTLQPLETVFAAGVEGTLRFQIRGADRRPVTEFATVNETRLHLLIARRDLTGYQHLHPTLGPDGVWSTPLTLPDAGAWRAVADFTVADSALTPMALGVDLVVPGDFAPRPLPGASRESFVDGFTVTYEGTPQVGMMSRIVLRVYQAGVPVTELEPYLGSFGHLVAFRQGDMGYLHVHADDSAGQAGVPVWMTVPSAGTYRIFFDFKASGMVHTVAFTLDVT